MLSHKFKSFPFTNPFSYFPLATCSFKKNVIHNRNFPCACSNPGIWLPPSCIPLENMVGRIAKDMDWNLSAYGLRNTQSKSGLQGGLFIRQRAWIMSDPRRTRQCADQALEVPGRSRCHQGLLAVQAGQTRYRRATAKYPRVSQIFAEVYCPQSIWRV